MTTRAIAPAGRAMALLCCWIAFSAAPSCAAEPGNGPPAAAPASRPPLRCPESYGGDAERSAARAAFRAWVRAEHPAWTEQEALTYRDRLLASQGCGGEMADSLTVRTGVAGDAVGLAPAIGAASTTFGKDEIAAMPQGDNAPFSRILLRAPGVVEDSFGEVHVRGEHGNVQYRLNGVLLPESLNGFAQQIDSRFLDSVTLTAGALPAQFGLRTAGIVDVRTKTGAELRGGEAGLYGGSFGTLQGTVQEGGTHGPLDYFLSATYRSTALGIENPTASATALHDRSDQCRAFGSLSAAVDPASRLSLLASFATSGFQIPDTPGLVPRFQVGGAPAPDSAALDERQHEQNGYAVAAGQTVRDGRVLEAALFDRSGRIRFSPDPLGDLAFSGVASRVDQTFDSTGLDLNGSQRAGDRHTLRFGTLVARETARRDTDSLVLPATDDRAPLAGPPFTIAGGQRLAGTEIGVYVQDEWRPRGPLTINAGLRYDRTDTLRAESQASPRLNAVLRLAEGTLLHAGYARYFTPPTPQSVTPEEVESFRGTTNAPATYLDSAPRAERSDYYDIGLEHQVAPGWRVSLDTFLKRARNQLDLGQFGNAVILAPFNYRHGQVHGGEFATTFRRGDWSSYLNLSYVHTAAREITSAEFELPIAELDYIRIHSIRLDHEGEITMQSGLAYRWRSTRAFADLLYGSGLRRGFANQEKLPAYWPLDLGLEQTLATAAGYAVALRVDLLNVLDQVYRLRDGTGVGIAASQYGARRALYGGVNVLF